MTHTTFAPGSPAVPRGCLASRPLCFWFANANAVDSDALDDGDFVRALTESCGIMEGATDQGLELYHDRFDMSKVVNENHRFGYVVEIDPYDPNSNSSPGKGQ